ncbi:MAG TPA: MBL fold metallo-hydrolase [Vicinamibacterales bacterium]|nr:MBL fold metallo-hydrolase [Vicinamibacterales bacterium]
MTARTIGVVVALGIAATCVDLRSQAPAPGAASAPGFDLSGYWTAPLHEDALERGAGPELADYGGFPINEAARLFALSYDASRVTLRHHQCDGYVAPYSVRSIGNARAWEERDPHTQRLIAIHWYNQTFEGHRVIWMDGRPHPPAYAPHTWMGFSTGRFVGNTLEVQTTHIKQGWLRRNGLPESDQAALVEFFVRHGDHLTHTSVINDPVYLTEPEVRTTDFFRQPSDHQNWLFNCDDGEQILGRAPDQVPNYRFGANPFVKEFGDKYRLPAAAYLGGAETAYPELAGRIPTLTEADARAKLLPSAGEVTSRAVDPEPRDGEIHTWPLRDNLYLLAGDQGNIVVQAGDEGAFVVDTGSGRLADKVVAAIRRLSEKPIQFIANTSFRAEHTGGNVALRASGSDPSVGGTFFALQFADAGVGATISAHQNVQTRMVAAGRPSAGNPSDTFLEERRRTFHNNDAVEMFWERNAVTDGDSIVHFRRADVIVAGDVFTTTQYPVIDLQNGGTVDGEIRALNDILSRTVYRHQEEGGTIVIPGHGYVCDEHEVVEYRDMMVIVRDRVRAMVKTGATLAQVKSARLTADYDTRYGATAGPWTTDMFIEAVYRDLSGRK